jgi:hypothetical protein
MIRVAKRAVRLEVVSAKMISQRACSARPYCTAQCHISTHRTHGGERLGIIVCAVPTGDVREVRARVADVRARRARRGMRLVTEAAAQLWGEGGDRGSSRESGRRECVRHGERAALRRRACARVRAMSTMRCYRRSAPVAREKRGVARIAVGICIGRLPIRVGCEVARRRVGSERLAHERRLKRGFRPAARRHAKLVRHDGQWRCAAFALIGPDGGVWAGGARWGRCDGIVPDIRGARGRGRRRRRV